MNMTRRLLTTGLLFAMIGALGGCAFFNRVKASTCPDAKSCATTILTDFRWGVDAAGSQLWLTAADVTLADAAVAVGLDTIDATPANWKAIVSVTLRSIQAHVAQADKWKPYIDAALLVLSISTAAS